MGGGLGATSLAVLILRDIMRLHFLFILFSFASLIFSQENSFPDNSLLLKYLRLNVQANVLQEIHLQSEFGKTDRFLNNTFSAGLEVVFDFNENFYYGIGAFYQFRSSIDTTFGNLGLLPVYAFFDFPIIPNDSFPIHLSAQLGYSPLILEDGLKNVSAGIFHSFGFTTSISKNVQIKFLLTHNYGKVKLENEEFSLRKENLSIAFYYKF
jgi:hypothetical protein